METPNYYAVIPANVRYDKSLTFSERLLYGEITALASKSGKCWASNGYFSELYDVTPQAISKWIKHLKERGYINVEVVYKSGSKEVERRTITLTDAINNGLEVSTTDSEVSTTDLYPYQQRIKENNTSGEQSKPNKHINIPSNKFDDEFEFLWRKYPRKQGKKEALNKYRLARRKGVSFDTINDGLDRYIAYLEAEGTDTQYIKHGSAWFCQESWEDEYRSAKAEKKKKDEEWRRRIMEGDE